MFRRHRLIRRTHEHVTSPAPRTRAGLLAPLVRGARAGRSRAPQGHPRKRPAPVRALRRAGSVAGVLLLAACGGDGAEREAAAAPTPPAVEAPPSLPAGWQANPASAVLR